jgi:hypothetical protein
VNGIDNCEEEPDACQYFEKRGRFSKISVASSFCRCQSTVFHSLLVPRPMIRIAWLARHILLCHKYRGFSSVCRRWALPPLRCCYVATYNYDVEMFMSVALFRSLPRTGVSLPSRFSRLKARTLLRMTSTQTLAVCDASELKDGQLYVINEVVVHC